MSAVQKSEPTAGRTTSPGAEPVEPLLVVSRALTGDASGERRSVSITAWLRTGTGLFSSVITLLAATLTVVFLLIPSLKPNSPAVEFGATLSDARIETDVTVSNYYARIRQDPAATLSGDDLVKKGVVISFTVVIEGFQGKDCELLWSVFDANTNRRSTLDWLVSQPGWPSKTFTPAGVRDQGNGEIFVQYPPVPGSYYVRMELIDPNGTRLATIDSPVFEVTGSTDAPAPPGLPTVTGQ